MRRRAIGLAWLLSTLVAFGELSATILVLPPGMPTLPVRIFGLLHYGVEDQVAAICLAAMIGPLFAGAGMWWAARKTLVSQAANG
jgi:iron(III) transport system permease protein